MKKYFLFTASLFVLINSYADENKLPLIISEKNACWSNNVELQGDISMDPACVANGTVLIRSSNTTLDCLGAVIDLQRNFDNAIKIDSEGLPLSNVSIKNCVLKNSKYKSVYIGWDRPDREKEDKKIDLYKVTPSNVTVYNTKILDSGSSGIYVDDYVSGTLIDRVEIINTPAMAVYFEHDSKNSTLQNSRIENSGFRDKREAVSIDSSERNIVKSNIFKNNGYGDIYLYRNCGEWYYQDGSQVIRKMSSSENSIIDNTFVNSNVAVWIASRQSKDQKNIKCGIGYFAEGKYALDDAKGNRVIGNKIMGANLGVIVEDDDNEVIDNEFNDVKKIAIRVGTPFRYKYAGESVKNTKIIGNKNSSPTPVVRYMWGSVAN